MVTGGGHPRPHDGVEREEPSRGPVAHAVGEPSEETGILVAIGLPGGVAGVVGIEYPMRMVDPSSVALIREMRLRS